MSSACGSSCSAPDSRSARMPARPSMIASVSACVRMPHLASIAACAMEPLISCLYIRPSTAIEELNASANAEVSASDRPAQSLFMVRSPCMIFAKPPLAMPRMVRGGGFYSFPCSRSACTLVGRPQMLMKPSASAWLKSLSPNVTRFSEYREYGEVMPALIMLPL